MGFSSTTSWTNSARRKEGTNKEWNNITKLEKENEQRGIRWKLGLQGGIHSKAENYSVFQINADYSPASLSIVFILFFTFYIFKFSMQKIYIFLAA